MPAGSAPELQQKIFKRLGLDAGPLKQDKSAPSRTTSNQPKQLSRKKEHKQLRTQKKLRRYSKQPPNPPTTTGQATKYGLLGNRSFSKSSNELSAKLQEITFDLEQEQDDSSLEDEGSDLDLENSAQGSAFSHTYEKGRQLSKSVREKLAQDDADIEDFEKKLGIKKGRQSLPQSFKDDGLDELLGDMGEDSVSADDEVTKKRKMDYDDWLSAKRQKTLKPPRRMAIDTLDESDDAASDRELESVGNADDDDDDEDLQMDEDDISGLDSTADALHAIPFKGFDDSEEEGIDHDSAPRRENPYVAPTEGTTVAKYVPPSKRSKDSGSDNQSKQHLQKRIQGLINRLTDANLISIVQSIEEIYQSNARGEVTEVLTDAILAQMRKPESLPDQFFVLTGGFSAAIYKITGSSFGSHMVRHVVKGFSESYDQASAQTNSQSPIDKECSNFLTFLTQLYVFEVVSCKVIFDYMERLLSSLSELNVELLLRVCRMAGRLLRRDDTRALKHVSATVSASVTKVGYSNVSARTKFMIETIQDLKNSKPKAKGMDSAVVSEHVLRMRKRLGELKSQSRRLDGLAPMGLGLKDVEGAEEHGKWWLVGASVPTYREAAERAKMVSNFAAGDHAGITDDEDMDIVLPDYSKKARAQGLNTTAQIAIFAAIMSAMNYEHGYRQYANLKLKKDEQLEITRVLVQCVGSELHYNEYYALVGTQACTNGRVRFSFQDRLWKIFRGLGESLFGEGAEDEESAEGERMKDERRLSNVARFYASLVADGALSITLLKPLELAEMNVWTAVFVEVFLISLLRECKGKAAAEDAKIERVFGPATELSGLAASLHWFLRKKIRKSKHIGNREAKSLQRATEKAQTALYGSSRQE